MSDICPNCGSTLTKTWDEEFGYDVECKCGYKKTVKYEKKELKKGIRE